MGWAAPRRPTHEKISCSSQGRLNHGANRPLQVSPSKVNKKVWRAKSPNAEISKSDKQKEIKETNVVGNLANFNDDIVAVPQGPMANDHEASTSKAKPRDPKYTQPKWCPPGLSKAQKRRLQRMRNHEKAEQEAEKRRDELFNKIQPMVPAKQVWRPKQKGNAYASTLATTAPTPPKRMMQSLLHRPHHLKHPLQLRKLQVQYSP